MTIRKAEVPQVWRFEEAKARLSQLVDEAMSGRPQEITRRGKEAVVVVSKAQWAAANGKGLKAIELIRNAPRLTEEEFAEFEKNLDRGGAMLSDREIDLG